MGKLNGTQKEAVLRTIAEVATNRIVLVTSGSWATNGDAARKYLQAIETALGSRREPCLVTIRISVSAGHAIKLGTRCAENLIRLFESDYRGHPYLRFQMHGFERDPIFGKVLESFPGCSAQYLSQARRESDDETVLKVIPQKVVVTLASRRPSSPRRSRRSASTISTYAHSALQPMAALLPARGNTPRCGRFFSST